MNTPKYVYWQNDQVWLGYLEEFPGYRTQGETRDELEENIKYLHRELMSGNIPGVRSIDQLEVVRSKQT